MVVLIVDDEDDVRSAVALCLRNENYQLLEAACGRQAVDIINHAPPDLIVLDYMMPSMDGLDVLRTVRSNRATKHIPVLFLTATSSEEVITQCFDNGADSYIIKPFSAALLRMQIKCLLQHAAELKKVSAEINYYSLSLSAGKLTVAINNEQIPFTPKEIELLKYLLENQNQVLSRDMILDNVWGYSFDNTRTVDCHISRLREKLNACPEFVDALHSVRGRGYCLGTATAKESALE